uniref:Glycosyltransferase n=1 Tax=Davidia involucrata TaxID=16924 RepID=A0A5B7A3D6_DAVIN
MASHTQQLHFVVVPLMSQSQLIPMTDFAKLVAERGITVTIITTPLNAIRFKPIINRATMANLKIRLVPLRFPCREAGLPEGCENMDSLTSPELVQLFFEASGMLQEPLEKLIEKLEPRPSCIISTNALPWTSQVSRKFKIPRFVFHAISCFTLMCSHNIHERVISDSESFLVPNMPHRIEFTKAQLPEGMRRKNSDVVEGIMDQMREASLSADGILVNSFEELEAEYVEEYKKVVNNTWCIGPVSLCNKEVSDKFDRGNKASIDEHHCLKWLDSMRPSSIIYACFGSLCHISPPQLIEIGLGLEASNRPFIWIIRGGDYSREIEKWLEEDGFEERTKERGLIIRGWAPQVSILSHPAVGGFLTHCGWNSTMEGVCSGVPMITWPMFAEQFYNEKFLVQVLRIGVRIGVEVSMQWGEEEKAEVLVKREQVKKAIDHLMGEGKEGEERRKRARELSEMAKSAIEGGGSSYLNMTLLIQHVMQQVNHKGSTPEYSSS